MAHIVAPEDDDPRRLLGELLRQARAEAGLTQDAISTATGIERSGITRAEAGGRQLNREALAAWLGRCGVADDSLAGAAIRAMWRVARRTGDGDEPVKTWFVGWVDSESTAWRITIWQPDIVPGLLQTKRYAYEVFRAGGLPHDRAEEAAAARMQRQSVLERDEPPAVVVIIDELVLQRQIGDREVMAEQCEKLLQASDHPAVLIQVVRGASAGLGGAVALAEGPAGTVVLTGSLLEDIVTADAGQVRRASIIVDAVRGASERIPRSREILGEAHTRWTA
jgi:transcriptional regulator with XRE-family HTH domain